MIGLTYVLPLRWTDELDRDELTHYLRWLSSVVAEVIVVDGSGPTAFEDGVQAWGAFAKVLRPDADLHFLNGKVDGVTTGIRAASYNKVIIADDDVRYTHEALEQIARSLDEADLVRPQNHFVSKLPWHAYIDGARSLLNRAVGHDFPGTFGVDRDFFLAMGGYDGDVMFENLELIRTVEAAGGRVVSDRGIYAGRLAPGAERYLSQRVRQAYDDFAQPARMVLWLSLVPMSVVAVARRKPRWLLAGASSAIAVAEFGRRRDAGRTRFPALMSLCAPVWLVERALASWGAVVARLRGGVRYGDGRIRKAARR